jgi:hypothetical protein
MPTARRSSGFPGDDCGLEGVKVAGRGEGGLDAEAAEELGDELAGAAVAIGGEDDVLAGAEHGDEGGGDGGHSAGEAGGVFGAFEGGELLLDGADGGVPVAAVLFALDFAFEVVAELGGVAEGVRGRGRDGVRYGVERFFPAFAAVDGGRAGGFLGCHGREGERVGRRAAWGLVPLAKSPTGLLRRFAAKASGPSFVSMGLRPKPQRQLRCRSSTARCTVLQTWRDF